MQTLHVSSCLWLQSFQQSSWHNQRVVIKFGARGKATVGTLILQRTTTLTYSAVQIPLKSSKILYNLIFPGELHDRLPSFQLIEEYRRLIYIQKEWAFSNILVENNVGFKGPYRHVRKCDPYPSSQAAPNVKFASVQNDMHSAVQALCIRHSYR